MGRPRKTLPSVRIGFCIPEDLQQRVNTHLASDVEGRVPHGVKSAFLEQLLREFFQKLDGESQEIEASLEK